MLLLAASLFFTNPLPLDMPKAEAYLVQEDGRYRLEDRFDALDLWVSHAVLGRWYDEEGRTFVLAKLDVKPPPEGTTRSQTRVEYAAACEPMGRRDNLWPSVSLLADCALAEVPRPPRQLPRGFKDVDYWQHPTNLTSIVCTFKPEKSATWYLAFWELAEGDDYSERMLVFERQFLDAFRKAEGFPAPLARLFAMLGDVPRQRERRRHVLSDERELLRADAHHNVTNYDGWSAVDATEFTVLSDLPRNMAFVSVLTNDLRTMRARYAETLPTHIDGTNVLCVARIFATRDEYLDAVDEDMAWTAAYWCPRRRELVAYLPAGGEKDLLRTIRHEAFHQYLSYATSMIPVAPWLNEGYAQYFEDEQNLDWGKDIDKTPELIDRLGESLPGVLGMDYAQFYDGTDRERRIKYRLAWSIAVFLEKGASDVRFQPFKTLKADYFAAMFENQASDRCMIKATMASFRNADRMKLFVSEWKRFWKEH